MTIAIASAFCEWDGNIKTLFDVIRRDLILFGNQFRDAGYGGRFKKWLRGDTNYKPYGSFGNGSAMRVAPVCFVASSLKECEQLAKITAMVTHNHKEGIKGAVCVASCMYLAKTGKSKDEIKAYAKKHYNLNFTLDEIRPTYTFEAICQTSVPQALNAFFESENYEDAVKNAISIGGDSDTLAAICGGIAGIYYGVNKSLIELAKKHLAPTLIKTIEDFEEKFIKTGEN